LAVRLARRLLVPEYRFSEFRGTSRPTGLLFMLSFGVERGFFNRAFSFAETISSLVVFDRLFAVCEVRSHAAREWIADSGAGRIDEFQTNLPRRSFQLNSVVLFVLDCIILASSVGERGTGRCSACLTDRQTAGNWCR